MSPSNGTGTTTGVTANNKIESYSFYINPAMVVASRTRLLGSGIWASIKPLAEDVVAHTSLIERNNDQLRYWFNTDKYAFIGFIKGV